MRKLMLGCVVATVVAGCAAERGGDATSPEHQPSRAASAWGLASQASQIDGEVLTATRTTNFADRRTTFETTVSCRIAAQDLLMTVESFVGAPEAPEPESAFATKVGINIFAHGAPELQPDGRMKDGKGEVTPLASRFKLDEGFVNRIKLSGWSLHRGGLFPIVLELVNGVGSFEVPLEASPELIEVLEACGRGNLGQSDAPDGLDPLQQAFANLAKEPEESAEVTSMPASAVATAPATLGPSFDCKVAANSVEKLICQTPLLGRLDAALAKNYRNIMAAEIGDGAQSDLQSTQRQWIRVRNECADAACVEAAYRSRLDAICDYPVLFGAHPPCTSSAEVY